MRISPDIPVGLDEVNVFEIEKDSVEKGNKPASRYYKLGAFVFTFLSVLGVFGYAGYEAWKIQTSVSFTRIEITPEENNFHALIDLNAGSSLKLSSAQISNLQCDLNLLDRGSYKHLMSFSSNSKFKLEPNQKLSLQSYNINMDLLSKTFQSAFVDGIDLRQKNMKVNCNYDRQLDLMTVFPVPVGKGHMGHSYGPATADAEDVKMIFGKQKSSGKDADEKKIFGQKAQGSKSDVALSSFDPVSGLQNLVDINGVKIDNGKLLVPINLPFAGLLDALPSSIKDIVINIPQLCEDIHVNVHAGDRSDTDGWAFCVEKQRYQLKDVGSDPIFLSVQSLKKDNSPVPVSLIRPFYLVLKALFLGEDLSIVSVVGQINVLNGLGGFENSKSLTLLESALTPIGSVDSKCFLFSNELFSLPFKLRICEGQEPGSIFVGLGDEDKILINPSNNSISFSALLPSPDIAVHGNVNLHVDASSNIDVPEIIYITRLSNPDTILGEIEAGSFVKVNFNGLEVDMRVMGKVEGGDLIQFMFNSNLRTFPSIPYAVSLLEGTNSFMEVSETVSAANFLFVFESIALSLVENVISNIVEPFLLEQFNAVTNIIGFYFDAVVRPFLWYAGHVENTFDFLIAVGVENGWHSDVSFGGIYFPVEGSISAPIVASDNVKFDFNLTRAGFLLPERNVLETQLQLSTNDEGRVLDFHSVWKDSHLYNFAELIAEIVYQYDLPAVEILKEHLQVYLMGEQIYSIDGSAHIRIDLVTPTPTSAPTVAPLPRILNEWQYCLPYQASYTFDATRYTTECFVEVCPGDILTASLCNTEDAGIWTYGDSYLRLQDPISPWIEYASSDDGCGLAAKMVTQISGDSCTSVKIVEGCSYYGYCSGRVGVLVTTSESTPTMKPTEVGERSVLPRILNEWQTCSSYYRKYYWTYEPGNCLVTLCPGDYWLISQCPSDYNQIESYIGFDTFTLHDFSYNHYGYVTRSYQCNPGYAYFGYIPNDGGDCIQYEVDSGCYEPSCSGNHAIYISTSPIGEVEQTNPPVVSRTLNTWSSCGAFDLPTSLQSGLSSYCQLEVCPGDIVTFAGCNSFAPGSYSSGAIKISATTADGEPIFNYEYSSCSSDSSHLILGSECQTIDISLQCNGYYNTREYYNFQPGCTGNLAVSIENAGPPNVITTEDQWEVCGSFFEPYGGKVLRLCEVSVCQGDQVEISFCNYDNYQFYLNGVAYVSLSYENGMRYENPTYPSFDESYGWNCRRFLWNNFPFGCSTVGVDLDAQYGSFGTVGIKKSAVPSPTFAPTPHVVHLNYTVNQWLYCDSYSAANTDSAYNNAPKCVVRLCPGDKLVATTGSEASQASCFGLTYLRLLNEYGYTVADNDQYYGNCGHLEYVAGGSTCADYTISEGCWFSYSCSGEVGVYITPAPTPTVLTHDYGVWQYCDSYESSNGAVYPCKIPLCPGDTVIASFCQSENSNTVCNGDTYLSLYDPNGYFVTSNDDYCSLCSRIEKFISSDITNACGEFTFRQKCFSTSKCSGRLGVYLPALPTASPSFRPSELPTLSPTTSSGKPTMIPTSPTRIPTRKPTSPTRIPTRDPTDSPTRIPTLDPTDAPTRRPSRIPTRDPTDSPTRIPTFDPTDAPTRRPSRAPSREPTETPTRRPTLLPSRDPTDAPTKRPTFMPSRDPTDAPTRRPTFVPTRRPTLVPSRDPTDAPTRRPTLIPTRGPTDAPTRTPSKAPSKAPTPAPTRTPSRNPSRLPTRAPTRSPTIKKV